MARARPRPSAASPTCARPRTAWIVVASALPWGALVLGTAACSAPISTIKSPAHPRVVTLRNTTGESRVLEIEPTGHQHLGASTTFTGRLKPGETKILYLYDGFTYRFTLIDDGGRARRIREEIPVAGDLELAYAGDSLVRQAEPEVRVGPATLVSSDSFGGFSEARLDSVVRELDVFLEPPARSLYHSLPPQGKRDFLIRFWSSRDPTPGTPRNEFREEVEARLTYVEAHFRSPAETGFETPRGRIWLKYGRPDRSLVRVLNAESGSEDSSSVFRGRAEPSPYEVWEYFATGYKYVFLDQFRSGRYMLLTSTDPAEPGRPDWEDLLPSNAVQEILRD